MVDISKEVLFRYLQIEFIKGIFGVIMILQLIKTIIKELIMRRANTEELLPI